MTEEGRKDGRVKESRTKHEKKDEVTEKGKRGREIKKKKGK